MRLGDHGTEAAVSWTRARIGPGCRQEVPDSLLKEVVDLMKMGPTSYNCLPARIVFVKSKAAKERLKPHLTAGNVDKTMAAPATRHHRPRPEILPASAQGPGPAGRVRGQAGAGADGGAAQRLAAGRLFHAGGAGPWPRLGPMSGFDNAGVDKEFFRRHGRQIELSVQCGIRRSGGAAPAQSALCFRRDCADNLSSTPWCGAKA